MKLSCFGEFYDVKAKECQICSFAIKCWEHFRTITPKRVIKSGYTIAIVHIIADKNKVTVDVIQEELAKRFGKKELNVYYYLSVLKKQGVFDVTIVGRQRFYSLR